MARITAILFSLTVTLCLSIDPTEKSHNMWITRVEKVTLHQEWVTDLSMKLKKIEKNFKAIDLNLTFLQDIAGDNVQCEMKVFQKSGGKWMKSPLDISKKSCCNAMKDARVLWSCLQRTSNMPETCPVPKGHYEIRDFDVNECDFPSQLPRNLPEDYKADLVSSVGPTEIFRFTIYAIVKKRIAIG